ncbi:chorismate synthase [Desulfotomaculum sp. 1211_IL3151]|uniref:chorismate synthase n=1 Tax=Desulfotomaculum sp. 1211_IL3151 TaxID=3084055 RepID=UPI002FDAB64A
MSFNFGTNVRISVFGQSHSEAIGVVLDGLPPGEEIDLAGVQSFMLRRAPGQNTFSTSRREPDRAKVISGLLAGKTCGSPLCAIIENTDCKSADYANIFDVPRPSHADYCAYMKYEGANDIRGGGHFSGRLTAPLCFAGAVCLQILERRGIFIGAHIQSIGEIADKSFDPVLVEAAELTAVANKPFAVLDDAIGQQMLEQIELVKGQADSIGGVIECCAVGVPVGLGEPIFCGLENKLATAVFAIPAVKGVEFGTGFASSKLRGSQNNDEFYYDNNGLVKTRTNHHGGILGGIASGMPIIMRIAFKPTPSIGLQQSSIRLSQKTNTTISIKGRHDPCIVPRAVPCVEAAMAITLLDLLNR